MGRKRRERDRDRYTYKRRVCFGFLQKYDVSERRPLIRNRCRGPICFQPLRWYINMPRNLTSTSAGLTFNLICTRSSNATAFSCDLCRCQCLQQINDEGGVSSLAELATCWKSPGDKGYVGGLA